MEKILSGEINAEKVCWDTVLEILRKLLQCCQDEIERASLNEEYFKSLEILAQKLIDEEISRADVLVEIFRFLRNSVVACKKNQDMIREKSDLLSVTVSFLKLQQHYANSSKVVASETVVAIRCALQFLANAMVQNADNSTCILALFSTYMSNLFISFNNDEKIVQYLAMIVHLGLKQTPNEVVLNSQTLQILLSNLHLEFVIYAMELLVALDAKLIELYDNLDSSYRIKLLSFLNERVELLSDEKVIIAKAKEHFVEKSDLILTAKIGDSDNEMCWELAVLLEVICSITSSISKALQSDSVLLTTVLFLLREIHELGKRVGSNNVFSAVEDLQKLTSTSLTETDDIRAHPTFQFKANLIRLISNLAYQNGPNQDKVRELECLPIILDSCKIDARNPFIAQWSVLAIRNLCEGNMENQSYVRHVQRVDSENLLPKLELIGLS